MVKCPKCGAEECFRSSAYAEWQCGSADDFGEFVEEDKCLRNQLAQKDAEIERLQKIIDERGKRHADKIANKILGFDKERE